MIAKVEMMVGLADQLMRNRVGLARKKQEKYVREPLQSVTLDLSYRSTIITRFTQICLILIVHNKPYIFNI